MAFEFNRNLQDANLSTTFTLGTAAQTATSGAFDLGVDRQVPENVEVELSIPALTTTMNTGTNTAGVTYIVEASSTSTFSVIAQNLIYQTFVGSTTTAIAAQTIRCRLPSNCPEFIRAKVINGATSGDLSTLAGTLNLRF